MAARVGIGANPAAAHDARRSLPSLRAAAIDDVLAMPDVYLLSEHVSDTGVITLNLRARLP